MRLALLTMGFHERPRPYEVPGFSEACGMRERRTTGKVAGTEGEKEGID